MGSAATKLCFAYLLGTSGTGNDIVDGSEHPSVYAWHPTSGDLGVAPRSIQALEPSDLPNFWSVVHSNWNSRARLLLLILDSGRKPHIYLGSRTCIENKD